ncbi:MAG: hypothetical protein S4CHLAM45_05740 [Chlamydiales bacterium]|nr:hypothetical protein [Chlamydiales bacterium]MCH9619885.1 hypothetical protein [Chlamydiales bacterium]MCH9622688.1 hypothetical protein [Chlamydiales bacterium]
MELNCHTQIVTRTRNILLAPVAGIVGAGGIACLIIPTLGSLLTGGSLSRRCFNPKENTETLRISSQALFGAPINCLIEFLNPKSNPEDELEIDKLIHSDQIVHHKVLPPLLAHAKNFTSSKKEIASRLTYMVALVASLIARLFDGIIALGALIGSFATLGHWEKANITAVAGFCGLGEIIADLFAYSIKIINPNSSVDLFIKM